MNVKRWCGSAAAGTESARMNRMMEAHGDPDEDTHYVLASDHDAEVTRLSGLLSDLRQTNELLLQWKGEIDSRLIARGIEFPADYHQSPKWAVAKLLGGV